jgi:hypothetical protein
MTDSKTVCPTSPVGVAVGVTEREFRSDDGAHLKDAAGSRDQGDLTSIRGLKAFFA